jgi:hypothetical protein
MVEGNDEDKKRKLPEFSSEPSDRSRGISDSDRARVRSETGPSAPDDRKRSSAGDSASRVRQSGRERRKQSRVGQGGVRDAAASGRAAGEGLGGKGTGGARSARSDGGAGKDRRAGHENALSSEEGAPGSGGSGGIDYGSGALPPLFTTDSEGAAILKYEPGTAGDIALSWVGLLLALLIALLFLRGGCEAAQGRFGIWSQSFTRPVPYGMEFKETNRLARGMRAAASPGKLGSESVSEIVAGLPRGEQIVVSRISYAVSKPRTEVVYVGTRDVSVQVGGWIVRVLSIWKPNSVDVDHVAGFSRYGGNLVVVDLQFTRVANGGKGAVKGRSERSEPSKQSEGGRMGGAWREGAQVPRWIVGLRSQVSKEEFECLYCRPLRFEEWSGRFAEWQSGSRERLGYRADGEWGGGETSTDAAGSGMRVRYVFDLLSEAAFNMKNPHVRGFRDLEVVIRLPGRAPVGGKEIASIDLAPFDPAMAKR